MKLEEYGGAVADCSELMVGGGGGGGGDGGLIGLPGCSQGDRVG